MSPDSRCLPYQVHLLTLGLEVFDGSATSLGGNGLYDPVPNGTYTTVNGDSLPGGTGGGCVATGPFANHTIYFLRTNFDNVFTGLPDNWTEPDPHCLTRDLNDWGDQKFLNQSDIDYMMAKQTVGDFNADVSGYADSPGLHGGGHYVIGGTVYEFFSSPQDPAFYLHHSMVDKLWSDWQAIDPANRRYVYNGTSTIFNGNSTLEVTNSTVLSFGLLGEATSEEVQDPMSGPYCYKYE